MYPPLAERAVRLAAAASAAEDDDVGRTVDEGLLRAGLGNEAKLDHALLANMDAFGVGLGEIGQDRGAAHCSVSVAGANFACHSSIVMVFSVVVLRAGFLTVASTSALSMIRPSSLPLARTAPTPAAGCFTRLASFSMSSSS